MSLLRRGAPRAQCWSGGAELQATGGSTREAGDRGTRVRDQAGVRWGGGGEERGGEVNVPRPTGLAT